MTNLSSSATQVQMLLSRDPSAAISAGVPSECLQALSATLQAVLAATESTQRLAAASASLSTPRGDPPPSSLYAPPPSSASAPPPSSASAPPSSASAPPPSSTTSSPAPPSYTPTPDESQLVPPAGCTETDVSAVMRLANCSRSVALSALARENTVQDAIIHAIRIKDEDSGSTNPGEGGGFAPSAPPPGPPPSGPPPATTWACGLCTFQNQAEHSECGACHTPRP